MLAAEVSTSVKIQFECRKRNTVVSLLFSSRHFRQQIIQRGYSESPDEELRDSFRNAFPKTIRASVSEGVEDDCSRNTIVTGGSRVIYKHP